MTIKYNTNDLFDNKGFAELLSKIGVKAEAVEGGTILDRDALMAIPRYMLPHLILMNLKSISSPFCTEEI